MSPGEPHTEIFDTFSCQDSSPKLSNTFVPDTIVHDSSACFRLSSPIGVFDSGVGGLTVARAIRDLLPHESLIYLADTAHTPYGPRPMREVRKFTLSALDALVEDGVKMLVIACNTASTAVLRDAYERYQLPVVEVIRPTVRSALALTKNGKIGLIGTKTTVNSRVYDDFFSMRPEIEFSSVATGKLVDFVERGVTSGHELETVLCEYLQPLLARKIDTLVLGCTHYPFLRGALRQIVGPEVALITSNTETANEVYGQLSAHGLLKASNTKETPRIRVKTTSADTAHFQVLARNMLGMGLQDIEVL